jgi:hypothetical protein
VWCVLKTCVHGGGDRTLIRMCQATSSGSPVCVCCMTCARVVRVEDVCGGGDRTGGVIQDSSSCAKLPAALEGFGLLTRLVESSSESSHGGEGHVEGVCVLMCVVHDPPQSGA